MSMQSLNAELLYRILCFVRDVDDFGRPPAENPPPYAYLAAVSRNWQSVIEQQTFNTLALTQHDFASAARIITPSRQPLVSGIDFHIQLPEYDNAARYRVEAPAEQHRNSEIFTVAVREVFAYLYGWKKLPAHRRGIRLSVHVSSPSDNNRMSREAAEELVQRLPFSPLRRYEKSLICFLDGAETLPDLAHVVDFGIHRYPPNEGQGRDLYRAVDPASAGMLVGKCKASLERVSLYLMDWPRGVLEERKKRRKTLAQVIDGLPRVVTQLDIAYWGSPPRDENCDPPNLLDEGETEDVLSVSLRRFYMRQKTQQLSVSRTILGGEFFRRATKRDRGKGDRNGSDGEDESGSDDDDDEEGEEKGSDNGNDSNEDDEDGKGSDNDSDFDEWWYGDHSDDDRRPSANLQDLRIDWPKVTPDGSWLYRRPEGKNADKVAWDEWDFRSRDAEDASESGSDDKGKDEAPVKGPEDPDPELDDPAYANKHRFRIAPVPELVNPLLKSMARVIRRMPVLQDFYWADASDWPAHRVEYNPNFDEGGGQLGFYGFGMYEDGEKLIGRGEPLVDDDVVELFTEMLSARKPEGEVEVSIE